MKDTEVKALLKEQGFPEHVWKSGKKGIIERWEKFVSEVEAGYRLHLEDYRNDLDLRAIIARVGLEKDAADADRRLRSCLVFSADSVWDCEITEAWWIFGYPKNAKGDLLKDLKAQGYCK